MMLNTLRIQRQYISINDMHRMLSVSNCVSVSQQAEYLYAYSAAMLIPSIRGISTAVYSRLRPQRLV